MPRKFTNNDIDKKILFKNIIRIDNYINIHIPINWKCLLCHNTWKVSADAILRKNGAGGCQKCIVNNSVNCWSNLPTNNIIDQKLINRDIKRLDNYYNSKIKMNWQCLNKKCNNIWLSSYSSIINNNHGCPICNIPGINEKNMHRLLVKSGIQYNPQYCIKNLNLNYPLYRIDAYIPHYRIAIEYNGRQHYEKTGFGSKCKDDDFEKQILRDVFIRKICLSNKIKLIEIDGRKIYGIILKKYIINLIDDIINGRLLVSTE